MSDYERGFLEVAWEVGTPPRQCTLFFFALRSPLPALSRNVVVLLVTKQGVSASLAEATASFAMRLVWYGPILVSITEEMGRRAGVEAGHEGRQISSHKGVIRLQSS